MGLVNDIPMRRPVNKIKELARVKVFWETVWNPEEYEDVRV